MQFYKTEADLMNRLRLIREDPWEFLKIVLTLDPADKERPIKPFPVHLDYLKYYVRLWQKHPKILVPKSRRMKMTWVNTCLYVWDTAFHIGRHNALVSKKEDDSDDLIGKCKFVLEHLDFEQLPKDFLPKMDKTYNMLEFPEINSKIEGFASGADQLRQYTFSGIFADELAFWEDAEKMYSASVPTLEGGGRFTGVSSPAPGFFKRLVFDELDGGSTNELREMPKTLFPMTGVEIRQNPKNGFLVFQLNYRADPNKTPEHMKHIKEAMPIRLFNQEYELQWDSFEGLPVFADWNTDVHGVRNAITPHIGLPLLLGFDFGLTPACIVAQMQEDTLCCLKEFTAVNMGVERFLRHIIPQLHILYPKWMDHARDFLVFIDPSGTFRKDTDESTCSSIIESFGFTNIVPGPVKWEPRKQAVEEFLTSRTKNGACFKVSMPNCPILTKGFQGGYRYDDRVLDNEPNKLTPKKDQHSHIQDALQYVASRILTLKPSTIVEVPRLHYSWAENQNYETV